MNRKFNIPWSTIIEYGLYFLCLYLIMNLGRGVPVNMRLWHYTYRLAQTTAGTVGRFGIYAEKAYWSAVERARG